MNHTALADLLFPDIADTPDSLEARYPARALPEGARVTRMAPSPTGFIHLGNLYGALVDERLAHQSGGVFYLRIEDTDQKREVPGGVEMLLDAFAHYGLPVDEGATPGGDNGAYGPYRQRQRAALYHVCARHLVLAGKAYPCFLTEAELAAMRDEQTSQKLTPGCYGRYAKYRDLPPDDVKARIGAGQPYVVRYKSEGSVQNHVRLDDVMRGTLEMQENDQDVVLLKADGIPTYHFAHVVDDHYMRTTLVVRGEEWLATLPIHLQLFAAMGWKPPKYLHTATVMRQDGGSKRKLSKRKDPEAALTWYDEQGYPVAAVKEYLMTLLNSNYEDWRAANPELPLEAFPFSVKKMSIAGALFDLAKLDDISRTVISRMTAQQAHDELADWAERHDPAFAALLRQSAPYALAMLAIGRGGKKPRKDITVWSGAKQYFSFFFDDLFEPDYTLPPTVSPPLAVTLLADYADIYSPGDDADAWFGRVKQLGRAYGFADDMKAYRQAPEDYTGSVADVSMVLRLAVTGRPQSPDLREVMLVMGGDMVRRRLYRMADALSAGADTGNAPGEE